MSEKKLVIKFKYGASAAQDKRSPTPRRPSEYDWNYRRIAFAIGIGVAVLALLAYSLFITTSEEDTAGRPATPEVPTSPSQPSKRPTSSESAQRAESPAPVEPSQSLSGTRLEDSANRDGMVENPSASRKIQPMESKKEPPPDGGTQAGEARTDLRVPALSKHVVRAQFTWGIKNKEPAGRIRSPAIMQPGGSVELYFFSDIKGMKGQTLSHVWSLNGRVVLTKNFQINGDRWRIFSRKQLDPKLLGQWKVSIRSPEGQHFGEFVLDVLAPAKPSK